MMLTFALSGHYTAKTSYNLKAVSTFTVNQDLQTANTRKRSVSYWSDNEFLYLIQQYSYMTYNVSGGLNVCLPTGMYGRELVNNEK